MYVLTTVAYGRNLLYETAAFVEKTYTIENGYSANAEVGNSSFYVVNHLSCVLYSCTNYAPSLVVVDCVRRY